MTNMKLNSPSGFDPYSGASKCYQPSADGAHFFTQCGKGPLGFGVYVFRQMGNNMAEYVNYGPLLAGRGGFDLSGDGRLFVVGSKDDRDEVAWAFQVPSYIPFRTGSAISAPSNPPTTDLSAIEARLSAVESLAQQASDRAQYGAERANYVKGLMDNLSNTVNELRVSRGGISRDEAWQVAADRTYAEVTNPHSPIAKAIMALVRPLVDGLSTNGHTGTLVDNEARQLAKRALNDAQLVQTAVAERVTAVQAKQIAQQEAHNHFEELWQQFVTYTDRRLLNLIWDRVVKVLRYKESTGKTAAELPVNDQHNLSM